MKVVVWIEIQDDNQINNNRYQKPFFFKTAIIKFDNDTILTQVFEAKDVLPQDIEEVWAGKQDDLVDVDKESFGEINLDDLKSLHEILCVKVIER